MFPLMAGPILSIEDMVALLGAYLKKGHFVYVHLLKQISNLTTSNKNILKKTQALDWLQSGYTAPSHKILNL